MDLKNHVVLITGAVGRIGRSVAIDVAKFGGDLILNDINLEDDLPDITIRSHPWRRLKSETSNRVIPLVGTSLWAAQKKSWRW